MALIHYYKFNGNLFDSVGGFDLVDYQYGTGFSTGILNNCLLASSFETRVSGQGNAPSAWLSSNTSEASAGVSEWTITGWVYIDSAAAMSQLIFETITPNGNTPQISFSHDIKNGKFSLNGNLYSSISALNTWHLVAIRKSGGNIYWSINSGAESSFSYVPTTSGNLTQFKGFRIGGTGAGYGFYYGKVDDFRLYNNDIGSSGVTSIYNGGSPSEASSSALKWETPIHHYKFTNNLNDSIGSDNATTFFTITYPSGLFANSPKCIELDDSEYIEATGASNWSTNSWSVAFWQSYSGSSHTVSEVFKIQGLGSGTNITWDYNPKTNFSWNLNGTFMFLDQWSSLDNRLLSYNHIAQRYSLFVKDFNYAVGEYSASGFPINYFSAGLYFDPGPTTVFQLDDLRIYDQALSGFDALQIYNNGNGTEYSTIFASGSFATITISGLDGSASGGSGAGSASGLFETITITPFSGGNYSNGSASGSFSTISISSLSGIAFPEFIAYGLLPSIAVSEIEAIPVIQTTIQLDYIACDGEITWTQTLPITGFSSAIQGQDAISSRITPTIGASGANIVFFEQRTIAASGSYTYDMTALTDFLGGALSLSRAYAITITPTSGTARLAPGASNPFQWFFASTTSNISLSQGDAFMFAQPESATITSGSKTLVVTNTSGAASLTYKIAILGGR